PATARMREVRAAGHECGIHAWDHVDWHDRAPDMSPEEIEEVVAKAHARFETIFGVRATLAAAPGWTATAATVQVEEAHGIRVSSNTRDGKPFYPLRADGRPSATFEIPTTLPTLDEILALDELAGARREEIVERTRHVFAHPGPHVHSIHTEIEGGRALGPL